jgi:hypothetical protein
MTLSSTEAVHHNDTFEFEAAPYFSEIPFLPVIEKASITWPIAEV